MAKIPPLILQVAVTGADTVPSQSPYIPITPDEIAEECHKCWKAGASMVHLHVREPENGKPTGDLNRWGELLSKVKARCGDLIIGVTSGGCYGRSAASHLPIQAGGCLVHSREREQYAAPRRPAHQGMET
jgi:uncharacterized protein (DUF849 family)